MKLAWERQTGGREAYQVNELPGYPDGNLDYIMQKADAHQSERLEKSNKRAKQLVIHWAHRLSRVIFSPGTKTSYYHCIGVFECDQQDCRFIDRPKTDPNKLKLQKEHPRKCAIHGGPLVYRHCDATFRVVDVPNTLTLRHSGTHDHHMPAPIKAEPSAVATLKTVLAVNPDVTPLQLATGTRTRPAAHELSKSWLNVSRLGYVRRKVRTPAAMNAHSIQYTHKRRGGCRLIRWLALILS